MPGVVVVGQVARDLVLTIERMPDEGGSAAVRQRQELLGGKGANQAVACRQLGAEVHLVGVVGDDQAGRDVVGQASDAVLVQLQQPAPAVSEALEAGASGGALVVADGAPADEDVRRQVLRHAAVVRADRAEIEALVGSKPRDLAQTVEAARSLLTESPRVVALAAPGEGNVVAWPEGHVVLPHLDDAAVDPTGAGDAFVAALTLGLLRGESAESASWWAATAAAQVVGSAGGRPDLDARRVRVEAQRAREAQEARK